MPGSVAKVTGGITGALVCTVVHTSARSEPAPCVGSDRRWSGSRKGAVRSALGCLPIEGPGGVGARPSHQLGVIVKQFTFENCEQT